MRIGTWISSKPAALPACSIRPTGRVRIGTLSAGALPEISDTQHPAYGPGEDWNTLNPPCPKTAVVIAQHPAYGPGEDWNPSTPRKGSVDLTQHPAYGPGEDWNNDPRVSRYHARLQHPAYGPGEDWNRCCSTSCVSARSSIRPTGRVRIGTRMDTTPLTIAFGEQHPAYGPGEDWNVRQIQSRLMGLIAASGLRAG